MSWRLTSYNKRSAKKYGWHPSWFISTLDKFDQNLIEAIKLFQYNHDLTVDGKVGPILFADYYLIKTCRNLTILLFVTANKLILNGMSNKI